MNYKTDNGEVVKLPLFMKKIGEGEEGRIYRYNNDVAIKLFKHVSKKDLEQKKDTSIALKFIDTKNFIRPEKLLLDKKGIYKGYTMPLIDKEKNKELIDIEIISLLTMLEELYDGMRELSKTKCIIGDSNPENIIVTDKIYFIDTASYGLVNEFTKKDVEEINRKRINYMILSRRIQLELLYKREMDVETIRKIETFYHKFLESGYQYIQDFLEKESLEKYDNIKTQIKSL